MTLRIFILDGPSIRTIQVDGRLTGAEVPELDGVLGTSRIPDRLDLTNLRSVDAAGLALLRRLRAERLEMVGVSSSLAWRLESDGT